MKFAEFHVGQVLEAGPHVLTQDEPFRSLGAERRAMIIHQQTLIATFEPDRAS